MLNIVFMGTPDFAQKSLKAIYEKGYNIQAVVTNVDKPKGRGMKIECSPVKEFAKLKQLKIYQPQKIKENDEFIQQIANLKPDLICVVAYGKILPKEILEIPKLGCINLHASLLPKYRGAAPIQWAVLNGDKITGVTTMYMNEGMDTGDIILKRQVEIKENETTGELWNILGDIGSELLLETMQKIEVNKAPRIKQEGEYTLAPMINKQMAKIDWNSKSVYDIKNLVRGLNPIMGAYTFYNNIKMKFWKVNVLQNEEIINTFPELKEYINRIDKVEPGTVLFSDSKTGLYIKAIEGIIEVLEIQLENSKKMNIKDFLVGNKIEVGSILG